MRRVRSFDVAHLDTDARGTFIHFIRIRILPTVTRRRDSFIPTMGFTPVIVPEGAPPSVRVASASAADVAARATAVPATTTRGGGGGGPTPGPGTTTTTRDDDGHADGEEEVFVRRRGAFAKDRAW